MKTKRNILIPLLGLLLLSCAPTPNSETSNSLPSDTSSSEIKSSTSENDNSSSVTTSTSEKETSSESSSETSSESSSTSESSSSSSSESSSENETSSSQESSEIDQEIPSTHTMLPIGNTSLTGPKNRANPVDISDYTDFSLFSSLPENFSFIQGNNKKDHTSDFYSESSGGGLKFSHKWYGFQTSVFNTWNKIEVRLKVSQTHNNGEKPEKSNPPFMHVYGYNDQGEFIYQHDIEQGKLTANTKEIKFYIENQPEVCYLEFRLNAFPFKGSQCYNFGISNLMLKGWPRV